MSIKYNETHLAATANLIPELFHTFYLYMRNQINMPSSTSIRDQTPFHLSAILGVAPDIENNCVGFAKTQHRRCKLPASDMYGRAKANDILDEGTSILESGEENIVDILEELAPLLLCRAHHQYQAGQLVHEWSRKVENFHERRRASAGLHFRSVSPAPQRDNERARRYRAPTQHAGRAFPRRRPLRVDADEATAIERDDSRSRRISSAPPRFNNTEQIDTLPITISATVPTISRPRRSASRTILVSATVEMHLKINLQADGGRLGQERYRSEREYSGRSTYRSRIGSRVFHDSSRQPRNDETRTLRTETRNRPAISQTISRSRHSEPPRRQTSAASPTRPAQTRSEAETSPSTSRERARTAQSRSRQQSARSREVTRRHVEGDCSICVLPLQEEDTGQEDEVEQRYEDDDDDDDDDDEVLPPLPVDPISPHLIFEKVTEVLGSFA